MNRDDSREVLVLGGAGQLGAALRERPAVVGLDRESVDVTEPTQVDRAIAGIVPAWVVNAAAYTAVDKAEEHIDAAMRINSTAIHGLAKSCADRGVRFLHVSTDFVFDGMASEPIPPDAKASPISVYGRSKWLGEVACRDVLGDDALIVRTAWVYASGHGNFVATMLRLMRSREEIGVVADQVGTPTWAETLADGILRLIEVDARGTHHLTDSGVASWYDFAVAIEEIGRRRGLLDRPCKVRPIRTSDYPTPARRPAYSVLDKTSTFELIGHPTPHWRESLDRCLADWRDPE